MSLLSPNVPPTTLRHSSWPSAPENLTTAMSPAPSESWMPSRPAAPAARRGPRARPPPQLVVTGVVRGRPIDRGLPQHISRRSIDLDDHPIGGRARIVHVAGDDHVAGRIDQDLERS